MNGDANAGRLCMSKEAGKARKRGPRNRASLKFATTYTHAFLTFRSPLCSRNRNGGVSCPPRTVSYGAQCRQRKKKTATNDDPPAMRELPAQKKKKVNAKLRRAVGRTTPV